MTSSFKPSTGGGPKYIDKDPAAILSYTEDWADWLAYTGTTIASCTYAVPTGLTKLDEANDDTTTTVRLSGGTAGTNYTVTCHIIAVNDDEDERSFVVNCKQR